MKNIKLLKKYLTRKFKQTIQDPRSKIQDPRSKIQDPRSEIQDPRSKIQDPRSKIQALVFLINLFINFQVFASPSSLTYQGRILKSNGSPLEYSSVSFVFQITDPTGQCVIYQEQVNNINMTGSAGVFDVPIGNGTIQYPLTASPSVLDVFDNSSTFSCGACSSSGGVYTCINGASSYTAVPKDVRNLHVSFYDGISWKTITPDNTIRSVPFAGYALSAESAKSAQKLGTNVANDFLLKAGLPTCGAGTFLTWSGSALTCGAISGTAGGTVTTVSSANSDINVTNGTSTPTLTLNTGTSANQIVKLDASAKLPAVDGSQLTNIQASQIPSLSAAQINSGTLAAAQLPAFSGDVTSSAGSASLTLANSGVTAGTYKSMTVDAKGRVTGGSNPTSLSGYGITDAVKNAGSGVGTTITSMAAGTDANKSSVASPVDGDVYMATDTQKIYRYDGSSWVVIASAGGSGGTITQVSAGTGLTGGGSSGSVSVGLDSIADKRILANTSGASAAPIATSISVILDTITGGMTQGSILYRDVTGWSVLSPGTGGQYLQTQGANANPQWSSVSVSSFGGNLSGDVSGTQGATSVDKIKGQTISATATAAGQMLRFNGTQWAPGFVGMQDLRSSVTGSNFFASSCGSSQTLTYDSVGDVMSCANIAISNTQVSGLVTSATTDTTNASNISSGTLNSARLPAASGTADGILNQIAQSIKGVKTFLDNAIFNGTITATGNISTSADLASTNVNASGNVSATGVVTGASMAATGEISADRIKLANSSATCNGSIEGSLRYNSTSKQIEYCNGTSWTNISSGTQANLSIGSPSSSIVKSGPVTFTVTYGSGVDTATITLATANITLGGTDSTGCSVTGVTGSGSTRTVTVNGCTGTGTVNISIAANTASSTTGDAAPAAGPSTTYQVDNTGPTTPTDVTLGSVPNYLTNTPTITYTAASDVGGSTVANHQVQIIKTSDSSVVYAWANHTSGSDVAGLSLATSTQYSVLVRAVDALGNIGIASTAVNWITTANPCPSNFILVPALAAYTSSEFCVAKYEMRNNGSNVAISQSTGTPWVSIVRGTDGTTAGGAWKACKDMGANYDLISNAQWQTIARNIADVASNWSSGTAYSGELNRGHSDNGPANALAAAADSDPCNGTGQTCSTSTWDSQRRTHNLSNGNVIWDFAGNVWEWMQDNNSSSQGANNYASTFNSGSLQTNYGNDSFCASPGTSPYCGYGYGGVNYSAGAVLRSGAWFKGIDAGVFVTALSDAPTTPDTSVGFRCVYQP